MGMHFACHWWRIVADPDTFESFKPAEVEIERMSDTFSVVFYKGRPRRPPRSRTPAERPLPAPLADAPVIAAADGGSDAEGGGLEENPPADLAAPAVEDHLLADPSEAEGGGESSDHETQGGPGGEEATLGGNEGLAGTD